MKRAAVAFGIAWFAVVSVLLVNTPAPGTDASRFEQRLRALREEIFFWHESMYIFPGVWKPDWDWYVTISRDIEKFQNELNRLPNSECAAQARSIVITDGPWISATIGDMPGIEQQWNDVIERLPLSCDEF